MSDSAEESAEVVAVTVSDGSGEVLVTRQQALRHSFQVLLEDACKDPIQAMDVAARFETAFRDTAHFAGHDARKVQHLYTKFLEVFLG